MSRRGSALLAITLASALAAAPAAAQEAPAQPGAEAVIDRAARAYAVEPDTPCRPSSTPGEIVVCGDNGEDQRIFPPSTSTDTGDLRPPNLAPQYPGTVVWRGCFLQKCPKEIYYIDVAALPKAPPGSDADLIARGELRGD